MWRNTTNKLSWRIGSDISNFQTYDSEEDKFNKLTKEELNTKLPITQNNSIRIMPWSDVITEPIRGVTLKDLIKALDKGMNKTIDPNDYKINKIIYEYISGFRKSKKRLNLITKLEQNKLTYGALLSEGPYYIEGGFKKNKGIWYYSYGT